MSGWIKLHRKILENIDLAHDNNAFMVFTKLLLLADSKGRWSGGRRQLAKLVNLNDNTLYKVLIRLEDYQMVNRLSNQRYSIITICNWRKYQLHGNRDGNQPVTNRQPTGNTLIRIENKNINNTNVLFGKPEINEVFSYWQETTGLQILSRVQANRNAASNLVKKHGADKVHQLIDGVALAQNDQYAPRISDFCDLQTKLNQLIVWGRQQSKSKGVKIS